MNFTKAITHNLLNINDKTDVEGMGCWERRKLHAVFKKNRNRLRVCTAPGN